jgi:hypothetical protein
MNASYFYVCLLAPSAYPDRRAGATSRVAAFSTWQIRRLDNPSDIASLDLILFEIRSGRSGRLASHAARVFVRPPISEFDVSTAISTPPRGSGCCDGFSEMPALTNSCYQSHPFPI